MGRLETRMGRLETRMDKLETTVAKLLEITTVLTEQMVTTNQRIDVLRSETIQRIDDFRAETNRRFNRVEANIGNLKGHFMEGQARGNAPIIAAQMGFRCVNTLPKGATIPIWDEAESAGLTAGISRDDKLSFWGADLVMEVATSEGERAYVAVEASFTANGRDTRRATRNAEYLNTFTGLPSFPSVASVHIDNRVQDLVEGDGAWTSESQKIFWHELEDITTPY